MVDGEWLMQGRRLTRIDEAAALARAEELAERALTASQVRQPQHRTLTSQGTP